MILRAEMEKDEITRMINHVYKDSVLTDTLGLNQVRAYRQDKIVAWQQDFDRLPKVRPTQMMSRKSSAFGSVRAGLWPPGRRGFPGPSDQHPSSASVSEAEESSRPQLLRKVTGLSFVSTSSASDASEPEADGALSRLVGKTIPLAMATANGVVKREREAVELKEECDGDSDSTIGAA
jgi:1-phosphatidylinositol-3-phosphate 5-kinase